MNININEKQKKIIIISSIVASILLIISIIFFIILYNINKFLNVDYYYNGISIENIDISKLTKIDVEKKINEIEQKSISKIKADLKYEDKTIYLTSKDFKFEYDTKDVLNEAYSYGRKGNIFKRYKMVKNLEKSKKNFEVTPTPNEKSIKEQISLLAKKINQQAITAGVKFQPNNKEIFAYTQGVNGKKINEENLFDTLKKELSIKSPKSDNIIKIPIITIPHKSKTIEELKKETVLISKFSTTSTNNANGNSNMRLALSKVNGTVLKPKETFSYNNTIGNSTNGAGGWLPAGAIQNGVLIQSYGGGICQGSTTIYGAVLRAGLQITERHEHGFPIGYVPIGQDAAVSYGSIDFKFTNNYDTPIYIRSYMYGTTLMVEIYGKQPTTWDNITVSSQTSQVIPPPAEQIIKDDTLEKGQINVEKEARTGYRANAWRQYYKNGTLIKTEYLQSSYYAPVQAIVKEGTKEPPKKPNPPKPNRPKPNRPIN